MFVQVDKSHLPQDVQVSRTALDDPPESHDPRSWLAVPMWGVRRGPPWRERHFVRTRSPAPTEVVGARRARSLKPSSPTEVVGARLARSLKVVELCGWGARATQGSSVMSAQGFGRSIVWPMSTAAREAAVCLPPGKNTRAMFRGATFGVGLSLAASMGGQETASERHGGGMGACGRAGMFALAAASA